MKKTKVLFILFLTLFIIFSSTFFYCSTAYNIIIDDPSGIEQLPPDGEPKNLASFYELSPDGDISFSLKSNGNGKIIAEPLSNYPLYYQITEISQENREGIEQLLKFEQTIKNRINEFKSSKKSGQYTTIIFSDFVISRIVNNMISDYITNNDLPEGLESDLQKVQDENDLDEKLNMIHEATSNYLPRPTGMGTQTTDGTFNIDLTQFSGDKAFAIHATLVKSFPLYDVATYTISGTKVEEVPVTSINLDKNSLTLTENSSGKLTATIIPSDSTNKSLTWSSSNTTVATVNSEGKVTAKSVGKATITVSTANNKTATCDVTVTTSSTTPSTKIDPQELISFSSVLNREKVISIDTSKITNYDLYYQIVKISDNTGYNELKKLKLDLYKLDIEFALLQLNQSNIDDDKMQDFYSKYLEIENKIEQIAPTYKNDSNDWIQINDVNNFKVDLTELSDNTLFTI
ncbi:MAG: Ig-like domain-containing protein [Clostridia bacterium]|nr:Ig-like domain-containing protein [Clostridia bacterium]